MQNKQKLVIVESPAKARTIAKFLGSSYKVEASQGHVRDLPKSQVGVDVDNDFEMKYITIRGRGDILATIRKEAKNAKQVFLATDPDREGEAISWHLAQILGIPLEQACRVVFHEITKQAVTEAVKHPRKIDMNLVDAQQARRALDRLVGYKISPFLWAKVRKGLSAGRVQSVATRLVTDREREIQDFIPEEYWTVQAELSTEKNKQKPFPARLTKVLGKKAALATSDEAKAAEKLIESSPLKVTSVSNKEKKRTPAPPFTTSTLQQEAGRKLNFTITKTMQIVQQLYEGIEIKKIGTQGLVTYIRTDSVRVSDQAVEAARSHILSVYGQEHVPEKPQVYKGRRNAQDAHEAIRPVDISIQPDNIKDSLTADQYKLYRLIYSRFIASQMSDAIYKTVTTEFENKDVTLRFYGENKSFAGFTAVYEESTDDVEPQNSIAIPHLEPQMSVVPVKTNAEQHFTQPPARFSEASLVSLLEEQGIGRPSTYAPTVSTIISRGYVAREKRRLFGTDLGSLVTDIIQDYFPSIVDVAFTAEMESELDAVEAGDKPWKGVLRDFYPDFATHLKIAEQQMEKIVIQEEVSDVPCEQCGAMMVIRSGRYGKFLACPNFPECRNTKPILNYIGVKCPKCGGEILEKISKKNRKFYGCENYPACDFVSWDEPINERCAVCGNYMTLKRKKNGEKWRICSNKSCCYHDAVPAAENNDD